MKHVGCAIHPKWFTSTAEITPNATAEITPNDYSKCILKTFTSVVIEHHLKWAPLCEDLPGPIEKGSPSKRLGRYDFYHCDRLVDWAIENKLHIKVSIYTWPQPEIDQSKLTHCLPHTTLLVVFFSCCFH